MRKRLVASVVAALVLALSGAPASEAVVGGRAATPEEFPFAASVQDADGFHFCGASVISAQWLVTAAHCVVDLKPNEAFAVTGRTDLGSTTGTRHGVAAIHVHPQWETDQNFDVALLQLATPTTVAPIALASTADDDLEVHGDTVHVAGWGDEYPALGLTATNQLRTTDLFVVGDSECGLEGDDAANTMCAEDFLEDSCYGDSGGPLWGVKDGRRVLLGVVSRGVLCALPALPGMYTEVNAVAIRGFITAKTGL